MSAREVQALSGVSSVGEAQGMLIEGSYTNHFIVFSIIRESILRIKYMILHRLWFHQEAPEACNLPASLPDLLWGPEFHYVFNYW